MAHQLLIQPPHDQEEGVIFRGASFASSGVKGAAAMIFTVALFAGFIVLFRFLLSPSLFSLHINSFWAALTWAALSTISTALTVVMLAALVRIIRSTASPQYKVDHF